METELKNAMIKGLNWRQPYASMMLHGKIETRTWQTSYRGLVLIIASKKEYSDEQLDNISGIMQTMRMIERLTVGEHFHNIKLEDTLGKAIAVGRLVDCRPMTKDDENKCFVKYHPPGIIYKGHRDGKVRKRSFQLWCHVYEDVRAIEPFDIKGERLWKTLLPSEIDKIKFI